MRTLITPLIISVCIIASGLNAKAQSGCQALFDHFQVTETQKIFFTDLSLSENNIASWAWNFGDGNTSTMQHPSNTYSNAGNYNVCLTITDIQNCQSTICHVVTVQNINLSCHAAFAFGQTPNTTLVSFTDLSSSDDEVIAWNWNFGDGQTSTAADPVHNYSTYGNYYACLTIQDDNNCQSTSCHHVILDSIPGACHAAFTYTQTLGTYDIIFMDQSESQNTINTWQWSFGDGHTSGSPSPEYTYEQAGTYNVCLAITDSEGCESQFCHPVIVNEISGDCHAFFIYEQAENILTIDFIDSSNSSNAVTSWFWDFGDGQTSIAQNPVHTFSSEGQYAVCLTITDSDGCQSTYCQHLILETPVLDCQAAFSFAIQADSSTVIFTDLSHSSHPIIDQFWTISDGSIYIGQGPVHHFAQPGDYTVCLSITDAPGCHSVICHTVSIGHPLPVCNASFLIQHTGTPLGLQFNDASTSNNTIVSWSWSFGDGGTANVQHPSHTYLQNGTYEVCLTIQDNLGCQDVSCHHIVVNHTPPTCDAFYQVNIDPTGHTITFNNFSSGDISNSTWLWDFGDGSVSNEQSVQHIFTAPGIYTVCLFMTDMVSGCTSHYCHPFSIHLRYRDINPKYAIQEFHTHAPQSRSSGGLNLISVTNPASHIANINFQIENEIDITFVVRDLMGNKLISEQITLIDKGEHLFALNTADLQSGLYVLTISADGELITRSLTVVK